MYYSILLIFLTFFYFEVNLYLENLTKITVLTYLALNFPKVNILHKQP